MELIFNKDMFLKNYSDPEDDEACYVNILNQTDIGKLYFKGGILEIPSSIKMCDIKNLKYEVQDNLVIGSIEEVFNFRIIDSNLRNPAKSNMAKFTITVKQRENQPPSAVGDYEVITNYGQIVIITYDSLVTNTTPPYADPEGDAPYMLKILSLPAFGNLRLNSIDVLVGQEIPFTEIIQGLLIYIPDNNNTEEYTIDFDFAISDTGSQQFTS